MVCQQRITCLRATFEFDGLKAGMQRKRVLANGGLLDVHLGACQQAAVDFMFAAEAVFPRHNPV